MAKFLYCKTKTAFLRLEKALQRQGIGFHQEKHNIPVVEWCFGMDKIPDLKNYDGIEQEVYEVYSRHHGLYGDFKTNFDEEIEFKKEIELSSQDAAINYVEPYDANKPDYWNEGDILEVGGKEYFYKTKRKSIEGKKPGRPGKGE
jgi:hypothetical protein